MFLTLSMHLSSRVPWTYTRGIHVVLVSFFLVYSLNTVEALVHLTKQLNFMWKKVLFSVVIIFWWYIQIIVICKKIMVVKNQYLQHFTWNRNKTNPHYIPQEGLSLVSAQDYNVALFLPADSKVLYPVESNKSLLQLQETLEQETYGTLHQPSVSS